MGYSGTAAPLATWDKKGQEDTQDFTMTIKNTVDAELRCIHHFFSPLLNLDHLTVTVTRALCLYSAFVYEHSVCKTMYQEKRLAEM